MTLGLVLRRLDYSLLLAVFGVVAVYGAAGWINSALTALGLPHGEFLYGLTGILIAPVFFNLPLAVRLLLPAWEAVPGDSWRLAPVISRSSIGARQRNCVSSCFSRDVSDGSVTA